MIKKQLVYVMECDHCGKICGEPETTGFPDKNSLLSAAEMSDWRKIRGGWYCPDCYEVDENDEYVPCGTCSREIPEKQPLSHSIKYA